MAVRRTLFLCLLTFTGASLCSCDDAEKRSQAEKEREQSQQDRAEQELMADPNKALPELQRRLERQLSVRDGVAFVTTDASIETTAVSRNSAWRVKCGMFGLSVSMPYGSVCGFQRTTYALHSNPSDRRNRIPSTMDR
jgi:hypothetical protein